jgi:hypothetical protein
MSKTGLTSTGSPRRWYYLNRFTLSTTSSPTFVGFFVCGKLGKFGCSSWMEYHKEYPEAAKHDCEKEFVKNKKGDEINYE